MPYAAKAQIEYEFVENHLEIYITFAKQMERYLRPLDDEPYTALLPALEKFELEVDNILVDIISAAWQDSHTLKLFSDEVLANPEITTLAYNGPDMGLKTTWGKQWEPWGAIVCSLIPGSEFKSGMILLWSGSAESIPDGWHLCDGTEGTPDLRERFIMGAGTTDPGTTGGTSTHNHTVPYNIPIYFDDGNNIPDNTPGGPYTSTVTIRGNLTSNTKSHLPPYYALCYIMKL